MKNINFLCFSIVFYTVNIHHKNNDGLDFYDLAVNNNIIWSKKSKKFINGIKDWIEENYPVFVMSKKYNL